MQDEKYNLVKYENKVVLSKKNLTGYPENYIEVENVLDKFIVSEVHRDTKQVKIETGEEEEANIYAIIFYKRLYDDVGDKLKLRNIRRYLDDGEEKKVLDCIASDFDSSLFSIDNEDDFKISLLHSGNGVDVKFGGEYLAENATLSRGYVVLYNYCEKLRYISSYYDQMCEKLDYILNRELIIRMYILGE